MLGHASPERGGARGRDGQSEQLACGEGGVRSCIETLGCTD